METAIYNPKGLESLLGYGRAAHERSGGVCQLCLCGAGEDIDFNLWRQFTIEHIIGEGDGGYLPRIRDVVAQRFAQLDSNAQRGLAKRIHEANIVTACHFCNSTTSRIKADVTMETLISNSPADPEAAYTFIERELQAVLNLKRQGVLKKLEEVRKTFDAEVHPKLLKTRHANPELQTASTFSGSDVEDTAPG